MSILLVAWYDLKAHLRDRRSLALLLLLPPLLIALVAYGVAPRLGSGHYLEPFVVVVVDRDNSPETRTLVQHLTTTPAIRRLATVEKVDEAQAMALLAGNRAAAVLIIPEGFVSKMARGENLPVTVLGNPARPLETALIRNLMESSAALVTAAQGGINTVLFYADEAGVSNAEWQRLFGQAMVDFGLQSLGRNQVFRYQTVSATGPASPVAYYGVALGVTGALFAGMAGLWDRRGEGRGLYLRLRAAGISPGGALLARLLVLVTLQALQLALTAGVVGAFGAWQLDGAAWGWVALLLLAVIAANAGLLLLISVATPSAAAANLVALGALALGALAGGAILPAPYLPPALRALGDLTVSRWAIEGLLSALFAPAPDPAVLGRSLAMLAGLAVVPLALAWAWLRRTGR
ncbi:MAG: ABC transporter permease [Bacillota bacterium]